MQKRRTAFHRLQNAVFTFDSQCVFIDPFTRCDPAYQCFGLMGIQVIHHQMPFARCWVTLYETLEVGQAVLLHTGRSPRGGDHLPADYIKVDESGQRPMPDVLKLAAQHMARLHRQVRMFALQGLHRRQLIHADGALTLLGSRTRTPVHLAALDNFLIALGVRLFG